MEKYEIVISRMNSGEGRNEIAKDLGYSSFYSLNTYMYRTGHKWDGERKQYYKTGEKGTTPKSEDTVFKAQRVISIFAEGETDPKATAERLGFPDHISMSNFMKSHGYNWSPKIKNYEKHATEEEVSESIEDYKSMLKYISKNFDKLEEFLSFNSNSVLPRYAMVGTNITKSVYMNNNICGLIEEYSTRKNLSQKEIFEIAVIEFLKKYGYSKEIESLLEKR